MGRMAFGLGGFQSLDLVLAPLTAACFDLLGTDSGLDRVELDATDLRIIVGILWSQGFGTTYAVLLIEQSLRRL